MLILRKPWGRFIIMVALITAVVSIIAFYGITPYQAWQEQQDTVGEVRGQLQEVSEQNIRLQAEIDRLSSYEEIERVARRDYGLVYPGEQAYVVLPPAEVQPELPQSWPYIILEGHLLATAPVK